MANKIMEYLEDAECHFKWRPEQDDMMSEDINYMEEKLLNDIKENPKVEVFALTLLSYILTKGSKRGKGINYEKAMQYADDAIVKSKCKGEELVAKANKMQIYCVSKKNKEVEQLFCDMIESQQNLTKHDHCRIMLTHAFALTCFGMKAVLKSVAIYKNVLEIDSLSPDGNFGLGIVLGRIRRYNLTNYSEPSKEEVGALLKACQLWEWNDPFSIVWYGCAKVQLLKFTLFVLQTNIRCTAKLFNKAVKLADRHTGGSCIVYKWCAKGYKSLCQLSLPSNLYKTYVSQQKECVDNAIKANPNDSGALHEAGMFYWRVKTHQDVRKAEEYLQKASECSSTGNFWADVDLIRFRKSQDQNYDTIANYTLLLRKYKERESGMDSQLHIAKLYMLIGEEFIKQGDTESAVPELVQAIELDRNLLKVKRAKEKVISLLQEKLEGISKNLNKGEKLDAEVPLLLKLAHVSYITGELPTAQSNYENVLDVDESNPTAKEKLCEIYYRLSMYDRCIQMGCSAVETLPVVKPYVARGYYRNGECYFNCDLNTANKLLWKSAELGLLEAGQKLIHNMKEECTKNMGISVTKPFYEECAKISHWFSGSMQTVSLLEEIDTAVSDRLLEQAKELCKAAHDLIMVQPDTSFLHLDLYIQLIEMRELRFEMTLKKMSVGSTRCIKVLADVKRKLDGCFCTFRTSHPKYRDVKTKFCFPYTPKPKTPPTESEKNMQDTMKFMKQKLEGVLQLLDFSKELPDLFDFLCKHQARYSVKYEFVPDFNKIANKKNHEAKNDEQEGYYDLAHKACIYVEELAIEFTKYMPSP